MKIQYIKVEHEYEEFDCDQVYIQSLLSTDDDNYNIEEENDKD